MILNFLIKLCASCYLVTLLGCMGAHGNNLLDIEVLSEGLHEGFIRITFKDTYPFPVAASMECVNDEGRVNVFVYQENASRPKGTTPIPITQINGSYQMEVQLDDAINGALTVWINGRKNLGAWEIEK